jgi:hypothetical protein
VLNKCYLYAANENTSQCQLSQWRQAANQLVLAAAVQHQVLTTTIEHQLLADSCYSTPACCWQLVFNS